jgi:hypothetical protein
VAVGVLGDATFETQPEPNSSAASLLREPQLQQHAGMKNAANVACGAGAESVPVPDADLRVWRWPMPR